MKILFFVHKTNRIRHMEEIIRALSQKGHTIRLALGKSGTVIDSFPDCPQVSPARCSRSREDPWRHFAGVLRALRDYARYLDPRFKNAGALRRRAFRRANTVSHVWLMRLIRFPYDYLFWEWVFERIERLIPSDKRMERFLQSEKPDIILVTPLVQFNSADQVEYIKSAHRLGIPVVFLPYSWDNLTNKGLMRIVPDRVFVWNATQKTEAIEYHGVPEEKVVVCGAWRFDSFYSMKPRLSREEFCRRAGLSPDRPFLLYLCSSDFVAAHEVEFVKEWIRAIRSSEDGALSSCGILIKPYPSYERYWKNLSFEGFSNTALFTREIFDGEEKKHKWGSPLLYEAIHHCHGVFGLNTSAMIEAAILSKPVYSLLVKEFELGQSGTLHFHYFRTVNGGLIHLADNMEDLLARLAPCVSNPSVPDERSVRFTEAFVRPHGLDEPVVPGVVREIENFGKIDKTPLEPTVSQDLAQRLIFGGIATLFLARLIREFWIESGLQQRYFFLLSDGRGFARRVKLRVRTIIKRMIPLAVLRRMGRLPQPTRPPMAPPTVAKLDYPHKDILIYVSSPMEKKWRARSCSKEPWTVKWLEKYVGQGGVLYDIGANVGTFSLLAAKLQNGNSEDKIIAFEPGYASFARLCENIVLNGCSDRIVPVPLPLSGETGMAAFTYRTLDPGQSRHKFQVGSNGGRGKKGQYSQPMLAYRLDDMVREFSLPKPAHIKLDVDGGEVEVLRGSEAVIGDPTLKSMLIEVDHALTEPVMDILMRSGLVLKEKFQGLRPTGEAKPSWYGLFVKG